MRVDLIFSFCSWSLVCHILCVCHYQFHCLIGFSTAPLNTELTSELFLAWIGVPIMRRSATFCNLSLATCAISVAFIHSDKFADTSLLVTAGLSSSSSISSSLLRYCETPKQHELMGKHVVYRENIFHNRSHIDCMNEFQMLHLIRNS